MAARYTRKDAEGAMERLARALGKPVGHYRELEPGEVSNYGSPTHTTIPGGWALDHNTTYGGCVINELGPEPGDTWITQPFGSQRRTYREMVEAIRFALDALRIKGA